jgi:hypothetical protein
VSLEPVFHDNYGVVCPDKLAEAAQASALDSVTRLSALQ